MHNKYLIGFVAIYIAYAAFVWAIYFTTASGSFSDWWWAPTIISLGVPLISGAIGYII